MDYCRIWPLKPKDLDHYWVKYTQSPLTNFEISSGVTAVKLGVGRARLSFPIGPVQFQFQLALFALHFIFTAKAQPQL